MKGFNYKSVKPVLTCFQTNKSSGEKSQSIFRSADNKSNTFELGKFMYIYLCLQTYMIHLSSLLMYVQIRCHETFL